MLKQIGALTAIFLALISAGSAAQKDKAKAAAPKTALTDEEKEILKNRELLENLELLQNFEKIRYLGFLTNVKPGKGKEKPAAMPPANENARKDPSK